MAVRVARTILVRRAHEEVAAFVTDPRQVLPVVPGLARFAFHDKHQEGEEWDVFLLVGTLQVGGRVLATRPTPHQLAWESLRGTRHTFVVEVEAVGEHSEVTFTLTYRLSGLLMARVSELLARGVVVRHLEAGLEQLRHHLEHELP